MLWLPLSEMVNRGARFVLVMLLARQVGPHVYGSWVVAASLGMIVANGGDLGLSTVITTRVAADRSSARSHIANLLATVPVLVVVPGAALLVAASTIARDYAALLLLLGFAALLDSITYLLLAPLRACGRIRPEAALRAGQGSALLAAGVPLLFASERATAVAALFSVASAVATVLAVAMLIRSFGAVRPRVDLRLTGALFREALPLFGSVVVTLIYFRADSLLIAYLRGEEETGLYGAAYTLAFGAAFVPLMFQRVLLPRLAACRPGAELRHAFTRSLCNVSGAAVAIAACLVAATPLLPAFYGHEFERARLPYLVLVPALAVYFISYVNYTLLLARSRNAMALWLTVFGLLVNLTANLALIPALGATGAALAALGSETVLLVVQMVLVRRLLAEGAAIKPADAREGARPEALAA